MENRINFTLEEITLENWQEFRRKYESMPRATSLKEMAARAKNFAKLAKQVASVLTPEEIMQDTVLILAYQEVNPHLS